MSRGFGQTFHVCRKAFLLRAWLGGFLSHKTILSQFVLVYNTVVLGTYTVFNSALIVVAPEKALNAYFPMPFHFTGRITVTNEGSRDASDFYWNIDWVKLPSLPPDTVYFHAQYHQCTPCQGWYHGNFYGNDFSEAREDPRWRNISGEGNYVFLDAEGDGQFIFGLSKPVGRLE